VDHAKNRDYRGTDAWPVKHPGAGVAGGCPPAGAVGETQSGYLAALKQDNDTLALVKKIQRSESYQQLAQQ
jgi:uncharacterized protein YdbL (DUF1318 family)